MSKHQWQLAIQYAKLFAGDEAAEELERMEFTKLFGSSIIIDGIKWNKQIDNYEVCFLFPDVGVRYKYDCKIFEG